MSPGDVDEMPVGMVDIFTMVANDDIRKRNTETRR